MSYNNFNVIEDNVQGIDNLKLVEFNYNGQNVRHLVYIPDDISPSTSVFMYAHGADDGYIESNSFQPIYNMLRNNGFDSIIVMSLHQYTYASEPTGHEMNYFLSVLEDNFDINTDTAMYAGFSSGGPSALVAAMDMKRENPDAKPVVALIDSIYYNSLIDNPDNLKLLSGVTVLDLYNNFNKASDAKRLAENGVNIIRAFNGNGHAAVNINFFNNGLIDSFNGNLESLNGNYQFQRFDANSGKWIDISKDEVYELINNGSLLVDNPYKYFDKLSNLQEVKSENKFIENKLNIIRNAIKNSNFLSTRGYDSYSSTTNIPNGEASVVDNYFATCALFLNDLEKDTQMIAEIGNSYKDINNKLEDEANKLNDDVNSTYVGNSITNNTYIPSSSSYSSYGYPVFLGGIAATSSGEKIDKEENISKKEESKDLIGYKDLYSNKEQIVYDNKEHYIVVHHKDGKITGVEYYYDFKNEDIAISKEIDIKRKYSNIDEVVRDGQYIKVVFNEDFYKELSLDEIKEKYKDLKEIIKEN